MTKNQTKVTFPWSNCYSVGFKKLWNSIMSIMIKGKDNWSKIWPIFVYWVLLIGTVFISLPYFTRVSYGMPLHLNKISKIKDIFSVVSISNFIFIVILFVTFVAISIAIAFFKRIYILITSMLTIIILLIVTGLVKLQAYDSSKESLDTLLTHWVRTGTLIILSTMFVIIFHIISYPEQCLTKDNKEMVHKKYLAYQNNFIWTSVFGLLNFTLIFINFMRNKQNSLEVLLNKYPEYPIVMWLYQLFAVSFLGIWLVSYSFWVKLREIEKI